MLTEVTGAPAVGKSVYCQRLEGEGVVTVPFAVEGRFWFIALEMPFLILFMLFIPPRRLLYIAKCSSKSDHRWFLKVNVFRNVVKKIVRFELARLIRTDAVLIDEGISHIPFLLRFVERQDFERFFDQFRGYLEEVKVVVLSGSQPELEERLKERGHRRLSGRKAPSVSEFVTENLIIQNALVRFYREKLTEFSVIPAYGLPDTVSATHS